MACGGIYCNVLIFSCDVVRKISLNFAYLRPNLKSDNFSEEYYKKANFMDHVFPSKTNDVV